MPFLTITPFELGKAYLCGWLLGLTPVPHVLLCLALRVPEILHWTSKGGVSPLLPFLSVHSKLSARSTVIGGDALLCYETTMRSHTLARPSLYF